MNTLTDSAARLEAAVDAILALRTRVEAAAPWPLAELYGTEAEANWGPPELLAHLDEMLPFWLGEAGRILEGQPGSPVPFGRVASDVVRIGIIGRDRTVPLRELFARLGADAAREGLHPVRGVTPVAALFDRFVTGHLEEHVIQLRGILDARGI